MEKILLALLVLPVCGLANDGVCSDYRFRIFALQYRASSGHAGMDALVSKKIAAHIFERDLVPELLVIFKKQPSEISETELGYMENLIKDEDLEIFNAVGSYHKFKAKIEAKLRQVEQFRERLTRADNGQEAFGDTTKAVAKELEKIRKTDPDAYLSLADIFERVRAQTQGRPREVIPYKSLRGISEMRTRGASGQKFRVYFFRDSKGQYHVVGASTQSQDRLPAGLQQTLQNRADAIQVAIDG